MHIRYIMILVLLYFSMRVFAQELKHRAPAVHPQKVAIVRTEVKSAGAK